MKNAEIMSAEDILGQCETEYATIPGLKPGKVMRIKSLTAGDFIEWTEAKDASAETKRIAGLNLIIKSAVDTNGGLVMNESHLDALKKVQHKFTERILKEILRLNGMDVKEAEAKKG